MGTCRTSIGRLRPCWTLWVGSCSCCWPERRRLTSSVPRGRRITTLSRRSERRADGMSSRQLVQRRAARPVGAVETGGVKGASRPARPRSSARTRRRRWLGLAYAAPALIAYGFVVLVPVLQSVNYSFYSWDGVTSGRFVGLSNYITFFTDPELLASLGHVLVLVVFFAVLPIVLGLVSAALLGRGQARGGGIYRWVLFLPQVLTSVVVSVISPATGSVTSTGRCRRSARSVPGRPWACAWSCSSPASRRFRESSTSRHGSTGPGRCR